jgi:phage terminase large subunit
MSEMNLPFEIAEPMAELFKGEFMYRGAYGGRGSTKSWGFARKALQKMVVAQLHGKKCRVLCGRELQNSLKDSVLQLLIDQIELLKLQMFFDYGESYIRGKDGVSDFLFKGLRHNYKEIKSTEGIDIAWLEEAETGSEESFRVLFPTVFRNVGSEVWLSWNSESSDSPIHKRFILDPPPEAKIIKINYTDNPWFSEEMELLRQADLKRDPDVYAHVWEGECLTRTEAQVLGGKWRVDTFKMPPPEEIDGGPYYGCDWGFSSDPLALIRCWVQANRLYIDQEAGGRGIEIKDTLAEFDKIPGIKSHMVRADNARPELISHMQGEGYRVVGAEKWPGSVEDGITHLRSYDEIIIHERCTQVAKEARLWSYKVDKQSGDVLPVLIDANNHCFVGDTLIITNRGQVRISDIKIGDMVLTRFGFRKVTKTFDNGLKTVKEFEFPNGKSLTATDTHEIITIDGKKYIKDVTDRDTLYFQRGDSCRLLKAKKTRRSYLMAFLIDVIQQAKEEATGFISGALAARQLMERRSTFILPYGKKKMVLFLKDLMSIIKTTTLLTTKPLICNSGSNIGTDHTIAKTTTKTIRQKLQNILKIFGILPQNGIGAKRVENGTVITQRKSSKIFSQRRLSVNNAVRFTREIFQPVLQNFVQTLVNLPIAGNQVLIMRLEFAHHVERALSVVNTQGRRHAQELVRNTKERVFDISVEEHHEYFANGILVSNCMDALRYALSPLIKKKSFTGRPVYRGQFNEILHISLEELWPVKDSPIYIGIAVEQTTHCAIFTQINRNGQLRVLEEVIERNMGVSQFAKSTLLPLLKTKYKGCPHTLVSFRDRSSTGRTVDSDSRLLLDEMEEAGLNIESVSSDLLSRRVEAVRWYLGQLMGGRPAISISPVCRVLHDGLGAGYQFKQLEIQGGDDIRYSTDPEKNQYVLPNLALQYVCLWLREEFDDNKNKPVISGLRTY